MASRIRRHVEEKSKHTIYLSIIGSLVLVLFVVFYGVPLFTKYIVLLGKNNSSSDSASALSSVSYVAPPVLDETFTATNSANIKISGIATKNQTVKLYVNGSVSGQQTTDDKGKFIFDNVVLNQGSNEVKAKIFDGSKESAYSSILSITYANKGPNLTISSPSDNQTVKGGDNKTLHIYGTTDPNSNVTISGSWAIVDGQGKFSYDFPLQNGDNNITIVSTDAEGNATTVQKKVTFNP